jgi:hypothetical protein
MFDKDGNDNDSWWKGNDGPAMFAWSSCEDFVNDSSTVLGMKPDEQDVWSERMQKATDPFAQLFYKLLVQHLSVCEMLGEIFEAGEYASMYLEHYRSQFVCSSCGVEVPPLTTKKCSTCIQSALLDDTRWMDDLAD